MSKIKIFSMGGLDENGKNLYVIDVDNDLFIFDCGLKYASGNLFGIDYIIPDFSFLIENKDRIKGVFLTHSHYENFGGVSDLVREIPDIKIYATNFTRYTLLEDGVPEKNIIDVNPHKKIDFGENSVFPISVSHSCPDAVMYVLNTKDGSICYTGDFIIDPTMEGAYGMDLGKIAYVGKQNVLCLLSESVFSEKPGHTSPNHRLLQNVVNFGIENKYLTIADGLLGDLSNIEDSNSILLISDDRAYPFSAITKIINGYDKYIKLRPNDSFVFAEPRYDSTEKQLVKIENDLAMLGCNIISVPKDKSILHHASSEDLMLMIRLLQPKYYMPAEGEYRYMVGNANLASSLGIPNENIFLKQNGDVVEIDDGEYVDKFEHINIMDVLIDGKSSDDVGELVIKDREMLSESGIVLISATVSKQDKVLLVGPEITTRGFIYVKDSVEIIKRMKEISQEVIERNITPTYVDYNKIKTEIREELSKYLYDEKECKPM